jgi:hypothetical protein
MAALLMILNPRCWNRVGWESVTFHVRRPPLRQIFVCTGFRNSMLQESHDGR